MGGDDAQGIADAVGMMHGEYELGKTEVDTVNRLLDDLNGFLGEGDRLTFADMEGFLAKIKDNDWSEGLDMSYFVPMLSEKKFQRLKGLGLVKIGEIMEE